MTGTDAESEALNSSYQETDEKHLIPPVEGDGQAAPPEPQQALGLYREEAYKDNGGHQQIMGKFEN
jgi:hypothetical protein